MLHLQPCIDVFACMPITAKTSYTVSVCGQEQNEQNVINKGHVGWECVLEEVALSTRWRDHANLTTS